MMSMRSRKKSGQVDIVANVHFVVVGAGNAIFALYIGGTLLGRY